MTDRAPAPADVEAIAEALAHALHDADDSVDFRYCRHVAESQARALLASPALATQEPTGGDAA